MRKKLSNCPRLPSATHASRLLDGDAVGVPLVALDVIGRAALIATGMYVAGARANIPRYAIGGALALEAYVLTWLALTKA